MRKLKVLWRATRSQRVLEELETWSTLLLAIGAALLLYATLKAQAAHGAECPQDLAAKMMALFEELEHLALRDVVVDWPDAVELYPPAIRTAS